MELWLLGYALPWVTSYYKLKVSSILKCNVKSEWLYILFVHIETSTFLAPAIRYKLINNLFMQVKFHLWAYWNVWAFPGRERPQNNSFLPFALEQNGLTVRILLSVKQEANLPAPELWAYNLQNRENACLWQYIIAAQADFTMGTRESVDVEPEMEIR